MSSRATKKRIWRLKNMTNGEWLNMIREMGMLEKMAFDKWCWKYGLGSKLMRLTMTSSRRWRRTSNGW